MLFRSSLIFGVATFGDETLLLLFLSAAAAAARFDSVVLSFNFTMVQVVNLSMKVNRVFDWGGRREILTMELQ